MDCQYGVLAMVSKSVHTISVGGATITGNNVHGWSKLPTGNSAAMRFIQCTNRYIDGTVCGANVVVSGNVLEGIGAGSDRSGFQFIDCNNFTLSNNVGKVGSQGLLIHNASTNDYVILGNNIRSPLGTYNEAWAATRKVIEHNLW